MGRIREFKYPDFAFAKALSLDEAYNFGSVINSGPLGTIAPGLNSHLLVTKTLAGKNTITNFGINLILNNGLGVDLDIFEKNTTDILYNLPVNVLTGFTSQFSNAASLESKVGN